MSATTRALVALHAALIADGFDPGVSVQTLAQLLMAGLDTLQPDDDRDEIACERASAGIYNALRVTPGWPIIPEE